MSRELRSTILIIIMFMIAATCFIVLFIHGSQKMQEREKHSCAQMGNHVVYTDSGWYCLTKDGIEVNV